ncbi:MAG: hypothetical protein AB1671_12200 [Thermodesulfobacteriota bacterium]
MALETDAAWDETKVCGGPLPLWALLRPYESRALARGKTEEAGAAPDAQPCRADAGVCPPA